MKRTQTFAWYVLLLTGAACDGQYVLGDAAKASSSESSAGAGGDSDDDDLPLGGNLSVAGSGGASAGANAGVGGEGGEPNALEIWPATLPEARYNQPYGLTLEARDGQGDSVFRVVSGDLPAGLALSREGSVSGIPRDIGAFELVIEAEDDSGAVEQREYTLLVQRERWLAASLFTGSAAGLPAVVGFVDLEDPNADIQTVEPNAAGVMRLTRDGRWLSFGDWSSSAQEEKRAFVAPVSAAGLGPRVTLFEQGDKYSSCVWSADETRLLCARRFAGQEGPADFFYFDMQGESVGPRVEVGQGWGMPQLFDGNVFLREDADGQLVRVDLRESPPAIEPLGIANVTLSPAADGVRALVLTQKTGGSQYRLVNSTTGESAEFTLPPQFVVGDSLEAIVSWVDEAQPEYTTRTYRYHAVDDVHVSIAGELSVRLVRNDALRPYVTGRHVVHQDGDDLAVVKLADDGSVVFLKVGLDGDVAASSAIDPTGTWLHVHAIPPSEPLISQEGRDSLRRISAEGVGPALEIASDLVACTPTFSPDGSKLFLTPGTERDVDTIAPRLVDLSDPEQPKVHHVPLPLNWSGARFSHDSSYIAVIGGAYALSQRPLYVVDALRPSREPRLVHACSSNPAPLPGCPGDVSF